MPRRRDLTGQVFGELTMLEFAFCHERQTFWLARCSCGAQINIRASNVIIGYTTSCGHLGRRPHMGPFECDGKHNRHAPEFSIWRSMKARCLNPKDPRYRWYGARGITVCERWMSYGYFLADMGRKPSPELSIDRINNDGNYEPGNCRWATRKEQRANQRPRLKGKK